MIMWLVRNTLKYVKSSLSRFRRFKKCGEHEKLKIKGLVVLNLAIRWNSTYLMLDSTIKLRKLFESLKEEDDHDVNHFIENESRRQRVKPSYVESWESVSVLSKLLMTFYDITLDFTASLKATSNSYFLS